MSGELCLCKSLSLSYAMDSHLLSFLGPLEADVINILLDIRIASIREQVRSDRH